MNTTTATDTDRQAEDCRIYGHEWDLDADPASDYSCLHCGFANSPADYWSRQSDQQD